VAFLANKDVCCEKDLEKGLLVISFLSLFFDKKRERLTDKTFRDLGDDGISLGEKLSFFPCLSFDLGNTNKVWHILFGGV
jgi:hypothetical protein